MLSWVEHGFFLITSGSGIEFVRFFSNSKRGERDLKQLFLRLYDMLIFIT